MHNCTTAHKILKKIWEENSKAFKHVYFLIHITLLTFPLLKFLAVFANIFNH